jgi:hypothetical protein
MKRGKKNMVTNQTQTELREIKLIERVVSPTDLPIHARKVVIIQGKKLFYC